MSQASAYIDYESQGGEYDAAAYSQYPVIDNEDAVRRSRYQFVPYLLPTALFWVSSMSGGAAVLTDGGFMILTVLLLLNLFGELAMFSKRFGVGGIVVYGGSLVWFCHDYWSNWMGRDMLRNPSAVDLEIVARAAFLHGLFLVFMIIGLRSHRTERLSKFMAMREPSSSKTYFMIFLTMFAIGLSPYFWFTSINPIDAILGSMVGRVSIWLGGRTGSVSSNWSQYVAQILQVGQVAGVLGGIYAFGVGKNPIGRAIGLFAWLICCGLGYGTGRRGEFLFVAGPVVAFIFLKYMGQASVMLRRISFKGFAITSVLLVIVLAVIQYLGKNRGAGFDIDELTSVEMTASRGNTMFSEGLPGFAIIPDQVSFLGDFFPGATVILPVPETVFRAVLGIIPRALWPDKPIDPLWEWYNVAYKQFLGVRSNDATTISKGLVGSWYFRYGIPGLIQGAWIFGWLAACSERTIRMSLGRPLGTLIGLSIANYLFRSYRDFEFNNLYPIVIGAFVIWILVRVIERLFGGEPQVHEGVVVSH